MRLTKSKNLEFMDLLALRVAKDFINGDKTALDHFSHMSGNEAAYFAILVLEKIGMLDSPVYMKAFCQALRARITE